MKNLIFRPKETLESSNKLENYIRNSRDWIIYQNLIFNNIIVREGENDHEKNSFNKIHLTSDDTHTSAVYGPFRYLQFNHKFSKTHELKTSTTTDEDHHQNHKMILLNFNNEETKISDQDYLRLKNTFIPTIKMKDICMDISDSSILSEIKDGTNRLKISLQNLTQSNNNENKNFLEFKEIKNINGKYFNYNETENSVEISFKKHNIYSDESLQGKLGGYKNSGYKVYYDLAEHNPSEYDKIYQNIFKNLYSSSKLRFSNMDFTLVHNRFNLPIRVLINFEISKTGFTNSFLSIEILDYEDKHNLKVNKNTFLLKFY